MALESIPKSCIFSEENEKKWHSTFSVMELLSLQKSLKNQEVNEVNTAGSLHLSMCPLFVNRSALRSSPGKSTSDNCRTTNVECVTHFLADFP